MTATWEWDAPEITDPEVMGKLTAPKADVEVMACGRAYEEALARWVPSLKKEEEKEPSSPTSPASPASGNGTKKEKKKKATSTKLSEAELEGNHYELLELEDKEWEATEDEITKAYKKKCLETHPDKTGGDDTLFKAVQVAGEVLLSEQKRKAYDSSLPFDDGIPAAKIPVDRFYKTFAPVFERNGKWYLHGREKVLPLGNEKTPMETVDAFYTFWFSFKSWRDFAHEAAEHDLEQAEHREERRWMERENQRGIEKRKKTEMARILQLVERSYRNDPRIKQREADRIAEKERVREAKRQEEEDKKRKEIEEAERIAKEEGERKVAHKASQQNSKKLRQGLRKALKASDSEETINRTHVDWLIGKFEPADLEEATEILKNCATPEETADAVEVLILAAEDKRRESRWGVSTAGKKEEKKETVAVKAKETEWTDDELLELQKACVKYPAGSMERWKRLSEFMMDKRTPEQCLKKVKFLEQEYRMPQQQVAGGMRDISAKKLNLPSSIGKEATNETIEPTWGDVPTRKFKEEEKPAESEAAAEQPAAEEPTADIWSASQQKALETVLRDLKAYKDKDKWEKIAAAVEGKNKKQCVSRYKFLCSQMKK